jgi:hypothetical protein
MKQIKASLLANAFLLLFVSSAFGYNGEYYTYGTINIVAPAWQRMALIFSSGNYGSLLTIAVLLSGFILIGANILSWYKNGHGLYWAWMPSFLFGIMLYLIMLGGTGTLTVYDQTLNTFQQVNGVPNGIVIIADLMSKIEKNAVDLIAASLPPAIPYNDGGNAMGFNLLMEGTKQQLLKNNLLKSLDKYNYDCLFFEISQPSPLITVDGIIDATGDLTSIWSQAGNPAISTVYYSDIYPAGIPETCDVAWQNISKDLSNPNIVDNAAKTICATMSFDSSNAAQMSRCTTIMDEYISTLTGNASFNFTNFIMQYIMASSLDYTVRNLNPNSSMIAVTNYNTVTSMTGAGLAASEWLPVARGVFTAVAISLLPFLCLIIPTGLSARGIKMIIGFFVFLGCWGICDAVLHAGMLDLAVNKFMEVRKHNIGYAAMMLWPDATTKALATYGNMLTASIPLALVITTLFIEFGGYAMVSMASGIASGVQSLGTEAARKTTTPEGLAASRESWRESMPTIANANAFSMQDYYRSRTTQRLAGTQAGIDTVDAFGGMAPAITGMAAGTALQTFTTGRTAQKEINAFEGSLVNTGELKSDIQSGSGIGQIMYARNVGNMVGMDVAEVAQWDKMGRPVDDQMSERLKGLGIHIPAGTNITDMKTNADGTSISTITAQRVDGKESTEYRGGITTRKWGDNGWEHTETIGRDGKVMSETAARTATMKDPIEIDDRFSIIGGTITIAGDQMSSRFVTLRDNKTGKQYYGGFSKNLETGRTIYTNAARGRSLEDIDRDNKILERLNITRTGVRVETGVKKEKLDIDTTTVARGIGIRGVDGVTYWDADTALNISKDFGNSLRTARSFFTNDKTVNDNNVINYSNSFAAGIQKMVSQSDRQVDSRGDSATFYADEHIGSDGMVLGGAKAGVKGEYSLSSQIIDDAQRNRIADEMRDGINKVRNSSEYLHLSNEQKSQIIAKFINDREVYYEKAGVAKLAKEDDIKLSDIKIHNIGIPESIERK